MDPSPLGKIREMGVVVRSLPLLRATTPHENIFNSDEFKGV